MGKINFDFWYGDTLKDVVKATCYFSDIDCIYRGNLYNAAGRIIGDYYTTDSTQIERFLPITFD